MNNLKLSVLLLTLLLPLPSYAQSCDEFVPSFIVDGENLWHGLTPLNIYQREKTRKNETIGLPLKNLVEVHAKQGVLLIDACDGTSQSIDVAKIISAEKEGVYMLTLSKKNFFKLVEAGSAKPLLKRIYRLKLVP